MRRIGDKAMSPKERSRKWRESHPGANAEKARKSRERNPGRALEVTRKHRAKYPERAYEAWKRYLENRPGLATALENQRRCAQLRRTPPWADLKKIASIYKQAAELGLTVDHVIPLRGKRVSGLHVETNLRVISSAENSRKGNRFQLE